MSSWDGYARIGLFFVHFSSMEAAVEDALVACFRLRDNPAAPILHFIDFARKLEILKAAIKGSRYASGHETSTEWRENAEKLIKGAYKINETRKLLAHRRLLVADDGKVQIVSASTPRPYGLVEFKQLSDSMQELARRFSGMVSELEGVGLLAETGIFSMLMTLAPTASTAPSSITWQVTP